MSADETTDHETGLVLFGRKDVLIARKAIDVVRTEGAPWMIITGGVGKDSGDLAIPEAEYLAQEIWRERDESGLVVPPTYLDTEATNGGENTRNSLTIIDENQLDIIPGLTTVAHATSSRRLAETMKHSAHKKGVAVDVYRRASDYQFEAANPSDQKEARDELLRLANWPGKDFLLPQTDLPQNLVDFAQDQGDAPKPVAH